MKPFCRTRSIPERVRKAIGANGVSSRALELCVEGLPLVTQKQMEQFEDRRRHTRFDMSSAPSQLWLLSAGNPDESLEPCRLLNLSFGGMCFALDHSLEPRKSIRSRSGWRTSTRKHFPSRPKSSGLSTRTRAGSWARNFEKAAKGGSGLTKRARLHRALTTRLCLSNPEELVLGTAALGVLARPVFPVAAPRWLPLRPKKSGRSCSCASASKRSVRLPER